MKTMPQPELHPDTASLPEARVEELMKDDMQPEYEIDYTQARPNRFAARLAQTRTVELDADIATVFPDSDSVNEALRALVKAARETVPAPGRREAA